MKHKSLPLVLATALALGGCGTTPEASSRPLIAGDMVIRDEIELSSPAGWHLVYHNDPEKDHVATILAPNKPARQAGGLDVTFVSQQAKYRAPAGSSPQQALTMAVDLVERPAPVSPTVLDVNFINDNPAIGHSFTLKSGKFTQTFEKYFVFRSDGVWLFQLSSPAGQPIPSELREVVFNATWNEVAEPNVKYLGPEWEKKK